MELAILLHGFCISVACHAEEQQQRHLISGHERLHCVRPGCWVPGLMTLGDSSRADHLSLMKFQQL